MRAMSNFSFSFIKFLFNIFCKLSKSVLNAILLFSFDLYLNQKLKLKNLQEILLFYLMTFYNSCTHVMTVHIRIPYSVHLSTKVQGQHDLYIIQQNIVSLNKHLDNSTLYFSRVHWLITGKILKSILFTLVSIYIVKVERIS